VDWSVHKGSPGLDPHPCKDVYSLHFPNDRLMVLFHIFMHVVYVFCCMCGIYVRCTLHCASVETSYK